MVKGEPIPMTTKSLLAQDIVLLTQWLSPAYPVGAFSYSHGLEAAITDDCVSDADTLFDWLKDLTELGSGRSDAILLAAAYNAADIADLQDISELAEALSPSQERLMETTQQGAAFVRTTNAVWGTKMPNCPYPVAVGRAANLKNIDLETTAYMYLHAFVANLISAAVRLVPLGQTDGQKCLARLSETCEKIAKEASMSTLLDLGSCTFLSDIASMRHETQTTRLFQS